MKNKLSKNKQARRDYLPPALAAIRDTARKAGAPLNPKVLKMAGAIIQKATSIPNEPDQTKYERDTLIWMLIDITGEPGADLFAEAISEIKKLKEIREGGTHWAGNAVHFQQEANGLREQLAGKERLIESQREAIRKLRSEEWEARNLLEQVTDPEPCRLDHHGYCQTHLWVGKGECAHSRARKLLKSHCIECGRLLTKNDPPETDKCDSCYEDYER